MKQFKFFAVALAALTMFSCSKESDVNQDDVNGVPATINLKIVGSDSQGKAAGAPGDVTDVAISNGIIFLFKDGGVMDGTPVDFTGTSKKITTATTASKKVYVVANVGTYATSPLKNVKSEADLLAATGDLFSGENSTQTSTNLWMSGVSDIEFNGGTTATPSVQLNFVSARIDVVVKDQRTNNTPAAGNISIADNNVALLFAGSQGRFFGTDAEKVAQTSFYSGFATTTVANTTVKAALSTSVSPFTANVAGAVEYHFYTFGNKGNAQTTILTIESTRTNADGTDTPIFYPIQLNESELGAGLDLKSGMKYTITLTLKGEIDNGGGGGTVDPEVPALKADIDVTVTAAAWNAKVVSKEFN